MKKAGTFTAQVGFRDLSHCENFESATQIKRILITDFYDLHYSSLDFNTKRIPPTQIKDHGQANYSPNPGGLVSSVYLRQLSSPSPEKIVPHRIRVLSISQCI